MSLLAGNISLIYWERCHQQQRQQHERFNGCHSVTSALKGFLISIKSDAKEDCGTTRTRSQPEGARRGGWGGGDSKQKCCRFFGCLPTSAFEQSPDAKVASQFQASIPLASAPARSASEWALLVP